METSEAINEIATALSKAQGQMSGAVKDAANPFFKSKYADLASVWDACRKPLTDNGLAIVQSPSAEGTRVSLDTLLTHTSGQWLRGTVSVTAKEDSPQAVGSAITYLRRYALQSFVGVAPEDDDAEAAEGRAKASGYTVEAPAPPRPAIPPARERENPAAVTGEARGDSPVTAVLITKVAPGMGKAKGFLHHSGQSTSLRGQDGIPIYDDRLKALAETLCQNREPVTLVCTVGASGKSYVKAMHRVLPEVAAPVSTEPITADSIPF